MTTFLITGANGYVGSALSQFLTAEGHRVYGLSRSRSLERLPLHENFTFVPGDLDEIELEKKIISPGRVDTVIHLAWAGSAGPGRLDVDLQMANVANSSRALHLGAHLGATRFLGIGTVTENEVESAKELVGEPSLGFIYGAAKKAACDITRFEASRLGMTHVWARLGNIFSPGDSLEKFAMSALQKMLNGEKTLAFTPATQPMDFVSLQDAVRALAAAATDGQNGEVYYAGSGRPEPLRSYLELMRDKYSPDTHLNFGGVSFNGVALPAEAFSIDSLTRDTGYQPEDSFEDTLELTATWLRSLKG